MINNVLLLTIKSTLFQGLKFNFLERYWPYYLRGFGMTLRLAFFAVLIGTLLGIIIGMMRLSKVKAVHWVATGWVNFVRGIPVMLQIFIIYYGLASNMSDFWASVCALSVNSSAYIGEHIRAGIQAVDKGQTEAARSLGMTHFQNMMIIVIPQAIKNILPSLVNEFILLIKNTSIVSVIGLHELMYLSNTVRANTYLAFEPLICAAVVYFCVTYVLKKLVGIMERRLQASD
jgi:His/Glu/Gln/Arg/opine family amino acid ABC transporter permease subunit